MKRLWLLLWAFSPILISAQDLIVKKDGDVIQAKVLKVGSTEVEYKKWSNQDGPLYSIEIGNILAINYQNGDKESFDNVSAPTSQPAANLSTPTSPTEIPVKPAEDNVNLLSLYNNQFVEPSELNQKDKLAKFYYPVWGITSQSVISDENLTISFKKRYFNPNEPKKRNVIGYVIKVQNKTNKNLYIDLANSFKVDGQGNSSPYYSNMTITTNTSSGSGVGLNIGAVTGALGVGGVLGTLARGVNVGAGGSHGTSVTESQDRILIIPPQATVTLPFQKKVVKNDIKIIPEKLCFNMLIKGFPVKQHEFKVMYDENNSMVKNRRIITYSTTPDFSTYSRLNIEFYLKAVLGFNSSWKPLNTNDYDMIATNWEYLLIGEGLEN